MHYDASAKIITDPKYYKMNSVALSKEHNSECREPVVNVESMQARLNFVHETS